MAVTKISVSLEEETLAAARIAAEEAGLSLSAWLSQAAQHAAKLAVGLAAVREYEATGLARPSSPPWCWGRHGEVGRSRSSPAC